MATVGTAQSECSTGSMLPYSTNLYSSSSTACLRASGTGLGLWHFGVALCFMLILAFTPFDSPRPSWNSSECLFSTASNFVLSDSFLTSLQLICSFSSQFLPSRLGWLLWTTTRGNFMCRSPFCTVTSVTFFGTSCLNLDIVYFVSGISTHWVEWSSSASNLLSGVLRPLFFWIRVAVPWLHYNKMYECGQPSHTYSILLFWTDSHSTRGFLSCINNVVSRTDLTSSLLFWHHATPHLQLLPWQLPELLWPSP